jgi:hypothetical protein
MLCQNCGRRASDTKSFCQHCGALAGEDSTAAVPPRLPQTVVSKRPQAVARTSASSSSSTVRRAGSRPARSGSNPIGTLIFWGLVVYVGYWFLSDGRDLRSLVDDLMQQRQEPAVSQPAPVTPRSSAPAARPPVPAGTARPVPPAAPVERQTEPTTPKPSAVPPAGTPARSSVPPIQPATPVAADPGIEGLSPAQVIQKLGRPASVVTVNGVTGWSYRDGALIVYFVKDRATLKPPR